MAMQAMALIIQQLSRVTEGDSALTVALK